MTTARSTKAEIEARVTEIYRLLLAGASRRDLFRFASERAGWNVTERMVERYAAAATKAITTSAAYDRDYQLGMAIEQLRNIYARSYAIQDFKTALNARRELNELLGLYAPRRIAMTDTDGKTQQFIAIIPQGPQDHATWSEQCKREREELDRQRATTSSIASGLHIDAMKQKVREQP